MLPSKSRSGFEIICRDIWLTHQRLIGVSVFGVLWVEMSRTIGQR
jgi:hypothetical protein